MHMYYTMTSLDLFLQKENIYSLRDLSRCPLTGYCLCHFNIVLRLSAVVMFQDSVVTDAHFCYLLYIHDYVSTKLCIHKGKVFVLQVISKHSLPANILSSGLNFTNSSSAGVHSQRARHNREAAA